MIAKRLESFDSSLIRQAFDRAGDAPGSIDLSIGFPEDDTPGNIKAAGIEAIRSGFTRYTPSNGILELREAIARKLARDNNVQVTPDRVTVTPGLTTAIALAYLALLDPDDEVLLPDPFFPPYRDLALLVGAKCVFVDTFPSFQLTAKVIEPLITPKSKVLVINSPNNPSGAVYPERELRRIARLAKKHNLTIISDEIYEHFAYDTKHFSIGSAYSNTLTFNGFSKAYAMTGWRVGYMAGPAEIINAVNQLQQYVVFSTSSIAQKAAVAALKTSPSKLTKKYRSKRDLTMKSLEPLFEVYGAEGAFFAFFALPKGIGDLEFVREAARQGVILLPSRVFSQHPGYVRLSYATNHVLLGRGLKRVKATLAKLLEERRAHESTSIKRRRRVRSL